MGGGGHKRLKGGEGGLKEWVEGLKADNCDVAIKHTHRPLHPPQTL
jgi:hypothetical protein